MKKIKIVEVVSGINGGVGMMLYNYLSRFNLSEFECHIICQDVENHSFKQDFEKLGIKIYKIPTKKQNLIKHFSEMYKIFIENKYDIAHFHMSISNVYGLAVAKLAGIKVRISHSHSCETSKNILAILFHKLLNIMGRHLANVYYSCGIEAGKYLFGKKFFNKGYVDIINNAIEINKFKFDEQIRNNYRNKVSTNDNYYIGMVGRLEDQKNCFYAIKIFNQLLKVNPNVSLILIGEGSQREKLEKTVKEHNIVDKVFFLGKHTDVYNWYMAFDMLLLPSKYEGLPIVMIEAQASGLPVIASTKITKELKETDLIEYIDIDKKNINEWVNAISDRIKNINIDRNKYFDVMVKSKYNIENEYNILEEKYKLLFQKNCKERRNDIR